MVKRHKNHRADDHAGRPAPAFGRQGQREGDQRQEGHSQRPRQAGVELSLEYAMRDHRVRAPDFTDQFGNGQFSFVTAAGFVGRGRIQQFTISEIAKAQQARHATGCVGEDCPALQAQFGGLVVKGQAQFTGRGGNHRLADAGFTADKHAFQAAACGIHLVRSDREIRACVDERLRIQSGGPAGVGGGVQNGAIAVTAIGLQKPDKDHTQDPQDDAGENQGRDNAFERHSTGKKRRNLTLFIQPRHDHEHGHEEGRRQSQAQLIGHHVADQAKQKAHACAVGRKLGDQP